MSSRLATMYDAKTLATACLYDTLRELDFHIANFKDWCRDVGKVEDRDVDGAPPSSRPHLSRLTWGIEAVEDLRSFTRNGPGQDIR
jgi:hypothetical protein